MTEQEGLNKAKVSIVEDINAMIEELSAERDDLEASKSVVEFMAHKQDFMKTLMDGIAPTVGACPYCRINQFSHSGSAETCVDCAYGKIYGRCMEYGSAYATLQCALDNLEGEINNYWRGKDYVGKISNIHQHAA